MAEFCLKDGTAAAFVLRLAGTGARLGVNGAPDATHPLAVTGIVFIKSGPLLADAKCVPGAADPTEAQVVIGANSTATVTHNNGQEVVVIQELSGAEIDLENAGINSFDLRKNTGGERTVGYNFW